MAEYFVLWMCLFGACGARPEMDPYPPLPPPPDTKALDNARLKTVRFYLALLERHIELEETVIKLNEEYAPNDPTGKTDRFIQEMKRDIVSTRDFIARLKREERELVAAGATMPLPRAPYPRKRPRVD
jgi:hypothetical protein